MGRAAVARGGGWEARGAGCDAASPCEAAAVQPPPPARRGPARPGPGPGECRGRGAPGLPSLPAGAAQRPPGRLGAFVP